MEITNSIKKRDLVVDYLKAFSIIFVVIMHSELLDENGIAYLLLIENAVPVFMLLSGYTYALSSQNKTMGQLYDLKYNLCKFVRYTVPAVVTYIAVVAWGHLDGSPISLYIFIRQFILGVYGQGSYYYGLLIQMMIIMPVMLFLIKKYNVKAVAGIAVCNFLFECCCSYIGLESQFYRVLIFRYLLIISFGMYIGLHREEEIPFKVVLPIACVGLFYKLLPLFDYGYHIFTYDPWNRTSMLCALYVFSILWILLKYMRSHCKGTSIIGKTLKFIGGGRTTLCIVR